MMLPAPHLGFAVVVQAVQAKLVASTKPTTTAEAGCGDESKMGPYRRVCGGVVSAPSHVPISCICLWLSAPAFCCVFLWL